MFETPMYLHEMMFQGINLYLLKQISVKSQAFKLLLSQVHFIDVPTSLKMELAKKLLSENSYNVNEVSIKLGYSTASHFITAFKNKYGLTPKNFKKNY